MDIYSVHRGVERDLAKLLNTPELASIIEGCAELQVAITCNHRNMPVPTAATNGINLLVNPKFYRSLTYAQKRGLLLHECLHVSLGHSFRLPGAVPAEANITFDRVVNNIIKEIGPAVNAELPANAIDGSQFVGWSEERIHDECYGKTQQPIGDEPGEEQSDDSGDEPSDEQGDGGSTESDDESSDDTGSESGSQGESEDEGQADSGEQADAGDSGDSDSSGDAGDSGDSDSSGDAGDPGEQGDASGEGDSSDTGDGDGADDNINDGEKVVPSFDESGTLGQVFPALNDEGKPITKQESEKALAELSEKLRRGVARAGNEGAGGLRLGIERVRKPKAAWSSIFDAWVAKRGVPVGTSYRKRSRRGLALDLPIPGQVCGGINEMVIFVDVSYSMDNRRLQACFANLDKLRENVRIEKVTVVPFSTTIHSGSVVEVRHGKKLPTTFEVGGGTNFSCIANWYRRYGAKADAVVVFTDLGDSRYGPPPQCPILWASSDPVSKWNRPPYGQVVEIDVVG